MEEKSVLEVKMEEVAEDQGSRWPRWSFVGGLVMGLMICLEIVSSPRGLRTRAPADMLERSLRKAPAIPASDAAGAPARAAEAEALPDGWKFVAMYKGNETDPAVKARWTSQVAQDETVVDIFGGKKGGFFVDLASNDAVKLSNTLTLEQEYEWDGLCVEANPSYSLGYRSRRCQLAQAVVGPKDDEIVKFKFQGVYGGVVGADMDQKSDEGATAIPTVSIDRLFHDMKVPQTIDYLSLDIEGAEAWVFSSFPWDKYTFSVITAERPKTELRAAFTQHGYVEMCTHGWFGDEMWIHSSTPNFEELKAKYLHPGQPCRPGDPKNIPHEG